MSGPATPPASKPVSTVAQMQDAYDRRSATVKTRTSTPLLAGDAEVGAAPSKVKNGPLAAIDDAGLGTQLSVETALAKTLSKDLVALARKTSSQLRMRKTGEVTSATVKGMAVFRSVDRDETGKVIRRTEVGVSQLPKGGIAARLEVKELTPQGWVRVRRETERDGNGGFRLHESKTQSERWGEPSEAEWRDESTEVAVTLDGDANSVRRSEETTSRGVSVRAERLLETVARGADAKLPGNVAPALDANLPFVLEERVTEQKPYGEKAQRSTERAYHQGQTRIGHKSKDGKDKWVVEKQLDDTTWMAQKMTGGSRTSVRVHTEKLPDGSWLERREEWESRGSTLRPNLEDEGRAQRTEVRRRYDSDGQLTSQRVDSKDSRTGEVRTSQYRALRDGNLETHEISLKSEVNGEKQEALLSQRVRIDGKQRTLESVSLLDDDDSLTLELGTDTNRLRHENRLTGVVEEQEIATGKDGSIVVNVGGNALNFNRAGGMWGQEQLSPVAAADLEGLPLSGMPMLAEPKKSGFKDALDDVIPDLDFLGQVPAPARASLAYIGVASTKVFGPLKIVSAFRDSMKAAKEARNGNFVAASLYGTKATATTGKLAYPILELPKGISPVLGIAGGAADVALGVYGWKKAETDFGRLGGASKVGVGGAVLGMVAGGPMAPLLGSIVLLEGAYAFSAYKEKRYLPPLADRLEA